MAKADKQYARERRDKGLCGSCGNPARPGKTTCQVCADKNVAKAAERYQLKKASPNCTKCKAEPKVPDCSLCKVCLEAARVKSARDRANKIKGAFDRRAEKKVELLAKGICYRCEKEPVIYGLEVCGNCKADKQDYTGCTNYHQACKSLGKCVSCENEARPGKVRCQVCSDKRKDNCELDRQKGICIYCRANKAETGSVKCAACRVKFKEEYNARKEEGICVRCGKLAAVEHFVCSSCRPKIRVRVKKRDKKIKEAVFAAYGGYTCVCCSFHHPKGMGLEIDHINNDGASHRKEIKRKGGTCTYRWIYANKFPPGFQVLCTLCNKIKYLNKGVCNCKDYCVTINKTI